MGLAQAYKKGILSMVNDHLSTLPPTKYQTAIMDTFGPVTFEVRRQSQQYQDRSLEIVRLRYPENGTLEYLLAQFGSAIPNYHIGNFWLDPYQTQDIELSLVPYRQEDTSMHVLGFGHAWYYIRDKIIILWELFTKEPASFSLQLAYWQAFEKILWGEYPDAEFIAIARQDPHYSAGEYYRLIRCLDFREPPPVFHTDWGMARCYMKPKFLVKEQ